MLPGRPPVVDVLEAEDEEVADELDAVADHGEEHDHLVHHGAARRPHVGQVHAVVVVPKLIGVQEKLKILCVHAWVVYKKSVWGGMAKENANTDMLCKCDSDQREGKVVNTK